MVDGKTSVLKPFDEAKTNVSAREEGQVCVVEFIRLQSVAV
jgi:hypothetical protein